jgi:hypothetical protein
MSDNKNWQYQKDKNDSSSPWVDCTLEQAGARKKMGYKIRKKPQTIPNNTCDDQDREKINLGFIKTISILLFAINHDKQLKKCILYSSKEDCIDLIFFKSRIFESELIDSAFFIAFASFSDNTSLATILILPPL